MFRTVINDAKTAAGAVVGKYVLRASVALPFIAAGGFATAAGTLMLVEHLGPMPAYWIMAGIFTGIGLAAAIIVSARQSHAEVTQLASEPPQPAIREAVTQASTQLPLALLSMLLTTPFGPAVAGTVAKTLVRHLPLALLGVLIGLMLLAPGQPAGTASETAEAKNTPGETSEAAAPEPPPAEPDNVAEPAEPPAAASADTRKAA